MRNGAYAVIISSMQDADGFLQTGRLLQPRARLVAAMELLCGVDTLADIGCDHGRLSCAMIQRGYAARCIAIDSSEPSLQKARELAARVGVEDRVETRLGDGLKPLALGEADALALLGMGGTLIRRILEADMDVFRAARRVVLQPMRAADDIRRWLYEQNCHVIEDRVACQNGRYYQVFSVTPPQDALQRVPNGWPKDCFFLGYTAFCQRTAHFDALARRMLKKCERKLASERAPALERQAEQIRTILRLWEETT